MRSKTLKYTLMLACSLTLAAAVGSAAFGGSHRTADAARSASDRWVTVGKIYDEKQQAFKASELKKLFRALTGEEKWGSVKAAATGGTTSAEFREKNDGKNIELSFGGMKWDAVYLTTAKKGGDGNTKTGDVILDLWRSSDTLNLEKDTSKFKNKSGSADHPQSKYPDNMYSTSYARVKVLNAGGSSATSDTDAEQINQDECNQYARFTMEEVGGSLTQYIAKPSEVGYQEDEWDEATAEAIRKKFSLADKYYFPNDAYGDPKTGGKWATGGQSGFEGSIEYALNDKQRNEQEKYGAWKDDYLWLPSVTEAGVNNEGGGDGLWNTDANLRISAEEGQGGSSLLRSGNATDANRVYVLNPHGGLNLGWIDVASFARPALHLNLTKVMGNVCLDEEWNGDKKPYDPEGVTWTLDIDEAFETVAAADEEGSPWWNAKTHTITADKAGKYTVKVTPAKGAKWPDGTKQAKNVIYEVVPAQLEAKFGHGGSLQRMRETVFRVDDSHAIGLKMPGDTDGPYPIFHSGTETKVTGLSFYYVVETYDEDKYNEFQQLHDQKLEELKENPEEQWKNAPDPLQANEPKGYCVFFKAVDPNGNYNDYYDWFGVHVAREELEITISQEARGKYQKGEEYGYAYGSRAGLHSTLIESIQKITATNDGSQDRTQALKTHSGNFHFYLRTADDGGGTRYNFGESSFLRDGQNVTYLPVGTYYLYIYYNDKGGAEPTGENNGYIAFTWEGGRPSFQVTKKTLTVTANGNTITYGEAPAGNGVTCEGFADGEDESVLGGTPSYAYNYERYGDIDGSYTIMPQGYTSNNYKIEYAAGTLTVKPKELTVDHINGIYGLTYGNEINISAHLDGVVNEDEVTAKLTYGGTANDGTFGEGETAPTKAGSYTVTVTLGGAKATNYTLKAEGATQTFEIAKATVEKPTGEDINETYKGENYELTVTGYNGDTMSAKTSGGTWDSNTFSAKDAGKYTFTISLKDKDNYQWGEGDTNDVEFTITINKAQVSVEWSGAEALTYTGETLIDPTAAAQGLGEDGTIALDVEMTEPQGGAFKNAGEYTFKASLPRGHEKNYELTGDTTKEVTIAKATVEKPAADGRTFTYNGQEQTYAVTENPDRYTVTGNKQTNANRYTVTISLTDKNNYEWEKAESSEDLSYDFIIGKATLTVKANDNEIIYGDVPSANGVTYSGFVGGEDEKVLGGTLVCDFTYEQFGDTGEDYKIVPGGYTSDNYDIRFVAGALKVSARLLTFSVEPASGTDSVIKVVFKDKAGNTVALDTEEYALTYTFDGAAVERMMKAGEYTVTAELKGKTAQNNILANTADVYTLMQAELDFGVVLLMLGVEVLLITILLILLIVKKKKEKKSVEEENESK